MTERERGWILVALFTLAFLIFAWSNGRGGVDASQADSIRVVGETEGGLIVYCHSGNLIYRSVVTGRGLPTSVSTALAVVEGGCR